MPNSPAEEQRINAIRFLAVDAVQKANSGHPGLPMGAAALAYTLWTRHLHFNPRDPHWLNRDRFVLSAGHGSMLLYALLYLTGYDLTLDDLKSFRQLGSKTPGHPEAERTAGVEATTGPLGQGVANSVGMAIAEAHLGAVYNRDDAAIVDHYTYCLCGDGDLMEGISQEAISLAGHLKLGKLIVFYDDNLVSLAGPTDVTLTDDPVARFEASGWHTQFIDVDRGNDVATIDHAIGVAKNVTDRPSFIAVRTHIGYGSPRQDSYLAHGEPLGPDNVKKSKELLGWPLEPDFYVPDDVLAFYREVGAKGAELENAVACDVRRLEARQRRPSGPARARTARRAAAESPLAHVHRRERQRRDARRRRHGDERDRHGARPSSSADRPTSTPRRKRISRTAATSSPTITPDATSTTASANTRWRRRPTASRCTAACCRSPPPSSTSSITCKPAVRLACLTGIRIAIFVFTHDSVFLGEDGPTHEPIEQLAMLRATPNCIVIRPADSLGDAGSVESRGRVQGRADGAGAHAAEAAVPRRSRRRREQGRVRAGRRAGRQSRPHPDRDGLGSLARRRCEEDSRRQGHRARASSRCRAGNSSTRSRRRYRDPVLPPAVTARMSIEAGATLGLGQATSATAASRSASTTSARRRPRRQSPRPSALRPITSPTSPSRSLLSPPVRRRS